MKSFVEITRIIRSHKQELKVIGISRDDKKYLETRIETFKEVLNG